MAAQQQMQRVRLGELRAWDLSRVRQYMIERKGMAPQMAERVEREYRRFIELSFYGNGTMPISRPVDEFWHAHVLSTKDYAKFCEAVGGQFLHHLPTIGQEDDDLQQSYEENTLPQYEKRFGEVPPSDLWPTASAICTMGDGSPP